MNLEEENKQKRKQANLTIDEWFGFFFFPNKYLFSRINYKSFNEIEEERFAKFGFTKKLKQAREATFFGVLFYINLVLLIIVLLR